MVSTQTLDAAREFLEDYAVKHRLFSPTGDLEDGRFTVLHVIPAEGKAGIEIIFALTDEAQVNDPELPQLAEQCIAALTAAMPELKGERFSYDFAE